MNIPLPWSSMAVLEREATDITLLTELDGAFSVLLQQGSGGAANQR
jgi:hypothetical protein